MGHFGIARSVRLSVPWRSCLGYRHAGCLQLSHRRPPEMCGLWIRPRTDVDLPRFLDRTAIGGGISSRRPRGDTLFNIASSCDTSIINLYVGLSVCKRLVPCPWSFQLKSWWSIPRSVRTCSSGRGFLCTTNTENSLRQSIDTQFITGRLCKQFSCTSALIKSQYISTVCSDFRFPSNT